MRAAAEPFPGDARAVETHRREAGRSTSPLSISGQDIVHPDVNTPTGYPSAAATIAPGTVTVDPMTAG